MQLNQWTSQALPEGPMSVEPTPTSAPTLGPASSHSPPELLAALQMQNLVQEQQWQQQAQQTLHTLQTALHAQLGGAGLGAAAGGYGQPQQQQSHLPAGAQQQAACAWVGGSYVVQPPSLPPHVLAQLSQLPAQVRQNPDVLAMMQSVAPMQRPVMQQGMHPSQHGRRPGGKQQQARAVLRATWPVFPLAGGSPSCDRLP